MAVRVLLACVLLLNAAGWARETSETLVVREYEVFVKGLDAREVDSVSRAKDRAIELMRSLTQAARDEVYLAFEGHYFKVMRAQRKTTDTLARSYHKLVRKFDVHNQNFAAKNHPYCTSLRRNGCDIFWAEGDPYVDQQPGFLSMTFAEYLSPALADYLNTRAVELAQGYAEDAGLDISFAELGERVHTWEAYQTKYPNSPKANEANKYFTKYLRVFMTGMDNTRIDDWPNDPAHLRLEVRTAYETYFSKYPDTPTGRLIRSYYEVWKKNGFARTSEVDEFLNKNHILYYVKNQPPTR